MFYNTGIATYVWVLTNRKPKNRKGQVQLIDGSSFWQKMRKSLGSKRKMMSAEDIGEITRLFGECVEAQLATVFDAEGKEVARQVVRSGDTEPTAREGGKVKLAPLSRIFSNQAFGYRSMTVERPLRNEKGEIVLGQRGKTKGKPQPDSNLRDSENVPLTEEVETYFEREVLPHAADAWIDHDKTKVGYEIPFNRHFYVFELPRDLDEIDAELKQVTNRIREMLGELSA
jgi:type I restriction enzyme M protein